MRNFIYLLRINGLMLNNRLNAFDPTISPICTFCKILDRDTRNRDGHAHFFMECAITRRLLIVWGSKFEPQVSIINPGFFSLYWYSIPPEGGGESILINLLVAESFGMYFGNTKSEEKSPILMLSSRNLALYWNKYAGCP